MAMSHADCTHPRTPAGRAACRRQLTAIKAEEGATGPATQGANFRAAMRFDKERTSRRKHDERVRVLDAGQPPAARNTPKRRRSAASGQLKRPGTHLRTIGDLPDVPRMLAHGCRIAWQHGWDVVVGHDFNDAEKRIVITGDVAEVALVWRPSLPHGVWGVFVRKHKTSITHRVDGGVDHAMRIATGSEPFPG